MDDSYLPDYLLMAEWVLWIKQTKQELDPDVLASYAAITRPEFEPVNESGEQCGRIPPSQILAIVVLMEHRAQFHQLDKFPNWS